MSQESQENVIVLAEESFSRRDAPALPVQQSATPMSMLAVAVQKGMPIETIAGLMKLQEKWEEGEARKAFNVAFAAFKDEAVKIIKNRTVDAGPLSGKKYAELFAVVNAITPALSKHGLSSSWKLTRDEKEWIEVTCTVKHILGYSESVSMGGPPDTGGAKSPIQARASTVSYLERYTLKAICGVSEQDDDNDGNGGKKGMSDEDYAEWKKKIEATTSKVDAKNVWREAIKVCDELRDLPRAEALRTVLLAQSDFIDQAAKDAAK